jgi:uncharacterized Zn finger protein (UPF0148 family)
MENEIRYGCHCKRCNWDWFSKNDRPLVCPKCQSAYWDRERLQRNIKKDTINKGDVNE